MLSSHRGQLYCAGMSGPREVLQKGVEEGLHLGAQLYASVAGRAVLDFACGEARAGVPMRTDSVVQWFSSGKPLTAIIVAQLYERGELRLDEPVARYIPEFAANGKGAITLVHLLTHTGGFSAADKIPADTS